MRARESRDESGERRARGGRRGGRGQAGRGRYRRVGQGGLADIDVAQLVDFVTADCLLDVGKAGTMVHICATGRERLVGWFG